MKPADPQEASPSTRRDRRVRLLKCAAECRELAATAHTEDGRRVLLELAERYEKAASSNPA